MQDVEPWKRCFWSAFGEHLGLSDVYGEAKTIVSVAVVLSGLTKYHVLFQNYSNKHLSRVVPSSFDACLSKFEIVK